MPTWAGGRPKRKVQSDRQGRADWGTHLLPPLFQLLQLLPSTMLASDLSAGSANMGPSVAEEVQPNIVEVLCSRMEESANGSATMDQITITIPGVLSRKK